MSIQKRTPAVIMENEDNDHSKRIIIMSIYRINIQFSLLYLKCEHLLLFVCYIPCLFTIKTDACCDERIKFHAVKWNKAEEGADKNDNKPIEVAQ